MTKSWSIALLYLLLWACIHSLGAQVYKFGQSVDLTGSTKEASQNVLDGIITAFDEINQVFNGVRGIPVNLTYMDDGYVPSRAEQNSRDLIGNGSLALVGSIGTVSSIQSYPVASSNKVPMIGPITGSGAVRTPSYMGYMIHLSASYEDEAVAFVKYAVQKRLLNRISVFYQNDGFGKSGLKGVHDALSAMRMEIFSSGYFETNSVDIDAGYKNVIKPGQPQAIFFVTVSTQAALFVKRFFDDPNISRPDDTYFCFLSVIDINSFKQFTAGLPMPSRALQTETYPPYQANSSDPVVQRYLRQWAISFPTKQPSSGAVKGFMIGRFLHEALLRIDSTKNITGETIRDVIYNTTMFNIDGTLLGPYLPANIRGGCNQGIK
ncbi:periplasmic binding protein-like I [Paraphysoderma sedebokerense]|nr:periplasmic binding protein-like I [Paraphysoderma sedebokerense]